MIYKSCMLCSNRGMFTTFESVRNGKTLFIGNAASLAIKRKENVILTLTVGKQMTLKDVLSVPQMMQNIVLGSLLIKHTFCLVFESNKFVLENNGAYIGRGYKCGRMFKLSAMTISSRMKNNNSIASAYMLESFNLQHGRLGHVNYDSLR